MKSIRSKERRERNGASVRSLIRKFFQKRHFCFFQVASSRFQAFSKQRSDLELEFLKKTLPETPFLLLSSFFRVASSKFQAFRSRESDLELEFLKEPPETPCLLLLSFLQCILANFKRFGAEKASLDLISGEDERASAGSLNERVLKASFMRIRCRSFQALRRTSQGSPSVILGLSPIGKDLDQ
ncbi:hypothetical protein MRB53_034157 [Persea americana]|uniref:Uncharacterized protein n=1 Tax=Persea americana TaxID=3435 RepID=A0ACC2KX17_PERAE|nr:hypothetical protein MRB53_034157 [Persea americana]